MASTSARAAFLKYLQREEVAPLLLFWEGVSFRMRKPDLPSQRSTKECASKTKVDKSPDQVDKDYVTQLHHVGTELYQRFEARSYGIVNFQSRSRYTGVLKAEQRTGRYKAEVLSSHYVFFLSLTDTSTLSKRS